MFGRLSRGWSMAKASFAVLKQYPRLAILPLMSGTIFLIIAGAILASLMPLFGSVHFASNSIWKWLGSDQGPGILFYVSAFGVIFVMTAVAIFFNVALIHCALRALAGEEPSIRGGLKAAVALLPQILGWALLTTTVGFVLNMITDTLKEYLGFLGGLLGGLLEFSWAVVTYFVVPVLVTEKVGPITAVKRSAAVLRAKWGESLAGEARIGLIGTLFFLLSALVFAVGAGMVLSKSVALIGIGVILMVIGGLAAIAVMTMVSTLSTIFQTGVFVYATTGQVPAALDRDLIEHAFAPKPQKK
jgi:hypothetical protein